jgi:flagellar assembly protein FliH
MTATPQRKFTFDTEFHAEGDRPAPAARARQRQTLTVAELEGLQTLARHEGETTAAVRASEALERAVTGLTDEIRATLDDKMEALRNEAAEMALAMARKIAGAALAALPSGEVENMLRQAMHLAVGEPRLTLMAAPVVAQALEPRIQAIAREEGYDGRVAIAADPRLTGGDCRIEWRGGGAERSEQAVEEALAALLAQRFSRTDMPTSELPTSELPSSELPTSELKG